MARTKKAHGGVTVNHKKQLPRLRRIEGQVRGLQQMIENERDCIDIAHQISAVIAALRRVQAEMLSDHLRACAEATVMGYTSAAERRRIIEEISALISRLG
jgi:DNA-binding FrmR family transcriptional regulator